MVAGTTEGARATGAGRCGAQARSACFPWAVRGAGSERLLSRGVDCRRMYGRPSVHV